jgi:hypothetical protein
MVIFTALYKFQINYIIDYWCMALCIDSLIVCMDRSRWLGGPETIFGGNQILEDFDLYSVGTFFSVPTKRFIL